MQRDELSNRFRDAEEYAVRRVLTAGRRATTNRAAVVAEAARVAAEAFRLGAHDRHRLAERVARAV